MVFSKVTWHWEEMEKEIRKMAINLQCIEMRGGMPICAFLIIIDTFDLQILKNPDVSNIGKKDQESVINCTFFRILRNFI